eukprot:Skav231961  [mRNA]  locus=scaffold2806:132628:140668:- [translate_table: standard]
MTCCGGAEKWCRTVGFLAFPIPGGKHRQADRPSTPSCPEAGSHLGIGSVGVKFNLYPIVVEKASRNALLQAGFGRHGGNNRGNECLTGLRLLPHGMDTKEIDAVQESASQVPQVAEVGMAALPQAETDSGPLPAAAPAVTDSASSDSATVQVSAQAPAIASPRPASAEVASATAAATEVTQPVGTAAPEPRLVPSVSSTAVPTVPPST